MPVLRLTRCTRAFASASPKPHQNLGTLVLGISPVHRRTNPPPALRGTQIRCFSRPEFPPRRERTNHLLSSLVLLGTAGVLGYYLYGLYAKTQMWPPDVRSDLRAAIKARHVDDVDTAGVYYKRALDKCLAYEDVHTTLGVKHRLMLAGIAIALGGAYEDAAEAEAEAARDNHSSSASFASSRSYHPSSSSSPRSRDLFKRAYDAYEVAFVILAEGELDEHVWEHLLRAKNRLALRRLSTRLTATTTPQSKSTPLPDSVQRETYYRLIQVSSHLSHLAGILSGTGTGTSKEVAENEASTETAGRQVSGRSYEELEALHALFALASLQQGRPARHGHTLGLPRAESVSPGRFPESIRTSATAQSNVAASPSGHDDDDLAPSDLMRPLDAHGPYRLDYAYLLERAADVFARQGATRQALHLYRSAADALVPALTGEPETWATTIDLGKGKLPVRETCQVATLVNNMANVCAGTATASRQHLRIRTGSSPDAIDQDGSESDRIAVARASQPLPDVRRARQLALAAANLVQAVTESDEARMSRRLGANTGALRRDIVPECELARLVVAFNIGMLSEMLGEKVSARDAYMRTLTLAEVTMRESGDGELRAGAQEAEKEASDALDSLGSSDSEGLDGG